MAVPFHVDTFKVFQHLSTVHVIKRFKNGKIRRNKGCYLKKCTVADLILTFRLEITIKRLYVRSMDKQKVTKLGSLKLHLPKSDQDGIYNWP